MIDDGNPASLVLRQVVCCRRLFWRVNDIQLTFTPVAVVKLFSQSLLDYEREWMRWVSEIGDVAGQWAICINRIWIWKDATSCSKRFFAAFENYKCFFQVFEGEPSGQRQLKRLSFIKISRETLMRLMEKIFFHISLDILIFKLIFPKDDLLDRFLALWVSLK